MPLPPVQEIRFPATYVPTGEPILTSGKLIQIGQKKVTRAAPTACVGVELVSTRCIRLMAYKDQVQCEWSALASHPVRHIMEISPALLIMDVWDRQWLSAQWQPKKAHLGRVFPSQTRAAIRSKGRSRRCRSSPQTASRRHAVPRRRCSAHLHVWPLSTWVDKGGAHTKLTRHWQWHARPLHPRGRDSQGNGSMWLFQATQDPSCFVWSLAQPKIRPNFVASRKTSRAIQDAAAGGEDPWPHQDPWSQKPIKCSAKSLDSRPTPHASGRDRADNRKESRGSDRPEIRRCRDDRRHRG